MVTLAGPDQIFFAGLTWSKDWILPALGSQQWTSIFIYPASFPSLLLGTVLFYKKKKFFSLYICQKSGMTEGDTYLLAYSPNGHNNPFGIRQNTGNKKLHPTLLCKRQRPKCLGHLFAAS